MTAIEKAKELLHKMNNTKTIDDFEEQWQVASDYEKFDLKRKVLIAVDECIKHEQKIINQIQSLQLPNSFIAIINKGVFWEQVKHEINNF